MHCFNSKTAREIIDVLAALLRDRQLGFPDLPYFSAPLGHDPYRLKPVVFPWGAQDNLGDGNRGEIAYENDLAVNRRLRIVQVDVRDYDGQVSCVSDGHVSIAPCDVRKEPHVLDYDVFLDEVYPAVGLVSYVALLACETRVRPGKQGNAYHRNSRDKHEGSNNGADASAAVPPAPHGYQNQ
jgi:hypothetical protein